MNNMLNKWHLDSSLLCNLICISNTAIHVHLSKDAKNFIDVEI